MFTSRWVIGCWLALSGLLFTSVGVAAQGSTKAVTWTVDLSRPITEVSESAAGTIQWKRVVGAVRLATGEVLVGEPEGRVLRFSDRGVFLGLAMRRGRGPLELPGLNALLPLGDAAAAVFQGEYLTLGGPSPQKSGMAGSSGPPSGSTLGVLVGGGVLQARSAWRVLNPPTRIVRDSATMVVWSPAGIDTLGRMLHTTGLVFASSSITHGVTFGKIDGAAQLLASGRDSTIWYGVNDEPWLMKVTVRNGRVVSRTRVPLVMGGMTWNAERRAAWEKAALEMVDTPEKRILASAVWASSSLPDHMPRFRSIVSDVDGGVWVESFPTDPAQSRDFLVLSADGIPAGRIAIPADLRIAHISRCCLTVVRKDADDVEQVIVYPLSRRR